MTNCVACGQPIAGTAHITGTFTSGLPGSKLTGITFDCHATCFRMRFPDRDVRLPERISDPVAEPDMVAVELTEDGWVAICHECDRAVAMKAERDDAHLAAARHIARHHLEGLPA